MIEFTMPDIETRKVSGDASSKKPSSTKKVRGTLTQMLKLGDHRKIEQCSTEANFAPLPYHSLIGTAMEAFDRHHALALSPDAIWLTLLQGLAAHINNDPEKYRKALVPHEGKKELIVRRDEFRIGEDNPWEGVFGEFNQKIEESLQPGNDKLFQSFSTTQAIHQSSFHVAVMDVVKSFYKYIVWTMCGIPRFVILGEKSDWEKVREAFRAFKRYGLQWWIDGADELLSQIILAYRSPNLKYWESFVKVRGGSGGPSINGHITRLFPYGVNDSGRSYRRQLDESMHTSNFPSSISVVPFQWRYFERSFDMHFCAGMNGYTYDEDLKAIRPNFVWAVTYDKVLPEEVKMRKQEVKEAIPVAEEKFDPPEGEGLGLPLMQVFEVEDGKKGIRFKCTERIGKVIANTSTIKKARFVVDESDDKETKL